MLKVVETFSGIGSQAKALKNIKADFEIVAIAEWDINAIIAYNLIHYGKIDIRKYRNMSEQEIDDKLKKYTLSPDGKNPMKETAYKRLSLELKKVLISSIERTKNFVSIKDVRGEYIPNDIDLLTYSFPCQDLSLCGCWHGNKSGIDRKANNRSGMLWEIERILMEMHSIKKNLPKFLLMENVTNILSRTHERDFNEWKSTLERLGYKNHIYRLNAKNFGIPQNRERVYMISILCKNDKEIINKVNKYFTEHDLQGEEAKKFRRRNSLLLKDILKINYSDKRYLEEAEASRPNNTPSRQKILKDNNIIYDGNKIIGELVNTITTKQDRNPNSGLIMYGNDNDGKAPFRYLTPRECFMLMGFDEKDYQVLINNNFYVTKSRKLFTPEKLIKMAGNSIVVNVLEAIFQQIIDINNNILKYEPLESVI